MLKIDDNTYLDVDNFRRESSALVGAGIAGTVKIMSRKPGAGWVDETIYEISKLDNGSKLWGIDTEFGRWLDSGSCSMPIHCNGFGSPGCSRRIFTQYIQDYIDAAYDQARVGEPTYKERAMMRQYTLNFVDGSSEPLAE